MAQQEDECFSTWFDSPYYHILYNNRDLHEAQLFMDRLLAYLHPKPHERILDLACGQGRHSIYISRKGFDVTGIGLSAKSIAHARQFSSAHLHFDVHDMRQVYKPAYFDFVLNLFTSFGYFNNETKNVVALAAAASSLKPSGKLVIDFMNTGKIIGNLVAEEEKEVNRINFRITRGVENGFIIKTMRFAGGGREYRFEERVRALWGEDFTAYFKMAQLRFAEVPGDYNLNPFVREESDRMIFALKK